MGRTNSEEVLHHAKEVATEVGFFITKFRYSPLTREKDPSPSTIFDDYADRYFRDRLERRTGIPVFTEISDDISRRLKLEHFWWVDPIDGTASFEKHLADFAISLGNVNLGKVIGGVICEPHPDRMVMNFAMEGRGAYSQRITYNKSGNPSFIQPRRMRVSKRKRDLVAILGRSEDQLTRQLYKELGFSEKEGIRNFTGKALAIARGEADVYVFVNKVHDKTYKAWDTAAANVILNEAGGRITDLDGKALSYTARDPTHLGGIVMSNGYRHADICEKLRDVFKT